MYRSIEMFENLQQSDCDKTESEKLTSSQEDSHVRMLAAQVKELVSTIATGTLPEVGCGQSTPVSLAKLSRNGLWLKMFGDSCQSLLWEQQGEDSELYSGTWPTFGILLAGCVMELPMSVRPTEGTECLSWPTPASRDCKGANGDAHFERDRPHLDQLPNAVKMANWPPPRANKPEGFSRDDFSPTLAMAATGQDKPQHGQLNADWVEILMNYPIGWTDIDCDEPAEWPGWPAGLGWATPQASDGNKGVNEPLDSPQKCLGRDMKLNATSGQYPYEPPRVIQGQNNRAKRLKTLGNSVEPAQAYPIFKAIMEVENAPEDQTARP